MSFAKGFFRRERQRQAQARQAEAAKQTYPGIPLALGVEAFIEDQLLQAGAAHMQGFRVISLEQVTRGAEITSFKAVIEKDGRKANITYPPKESEQ